MKINEKIVSNSENNHHRNYEIYFLPRIITQCSSASSEAQVLMWLYVHVSWNKGNSFGVITNFAVFTDSYAS